MNKEEHGRGRPRTQPADRPSGEIGCLQGETRKTVIVSKTLLTGLERFRQELTQEHWRKGGTGDVTFKTALHEALKDFLSKGGYLQKNKGV